MSKRKSMKERLAEHAGPLPDNPPAGGSSGGTAAGSAASAGRAERPSGGGTDDVSPFPSKGRSAAVSFRSSPELFDALVETAARRKPARKHPYTQQDILCVALAEWLEKHGAWPPGE